MDTKRLLIGMAVAMVLVIGWSRLVQYLGTKNPEWGWQTPASTTQPSTQGATTNQALVEQSATPVLTTNASTQTATEIIASTRPVLEPNSGLRVLPAEKSESVVLGSAQAKDSDYTMSVMVRPDGAGLSGVLLNDFRASVKQPDLYHFQEPYNSSDHDESRPLATRSITVNGQTFDLLTADWVQVNRSADSVTYRATIVRGTVGAVTPTIQIDKTYKLTPRSTDPNSPQGFEITVSHEVKNLGGQPATVRLAFNGPTAPPRENDQADDRQIIGGYSDNGFARVHSAMVTALTPEAPSQDFTKDPDGRPLLWVGMSSVYFNAIVRPDLSQPLKIEIATVVALNLAPSADASLHDPQAILKLESNTVTIDPDKSVTSIDHVFMGPKKRELLNSAYYGAAGLRFGETLLTSGSCAWCTFGPIVNGLYFLLSFFWLIFRDWGLAIIALVMVVRAILHPITKRSQVNMAKMSKMGPEIERLKKKHGDNKDELNKAMMQFYKQQGATPILGCLPMLLQMPIWIALYSSLQSTFELRQAPFLWGFTWIKDLAHPDRLVYFPDAPINLFLFKVDAINVLPLILGVVSWIQAKVTRAQAPPATSPEQEQQQKMMQWMSLLLPVFLYNGPSGLNLYIITSSIVGLIESQVVRKHIKEREALEQRGAVIVDAPPGSNDDRPPTGGVRRKKPDPETPKAGGMMGWLQQLQQKAEDLQRDQQKRKRK